MPLPSPFSLSRHPYDLHSPYRPGPEFRARFEEPYSGLATGGALQIQRFSRGRLALGADDARHLRNLYDAEIRQQDARLGAEEGYDSYDDDDDYMPRREQSCLVM